MSSSGHAPGPPAPSELPTFIARLRSVVDVGLGGGASERDRADVLLTEGYARALVLERDCLRMRSEAAELAARVDEANAAQDLRVLAPALRSAEQSLNDLRAMLDELKASVLAPQTPVERAG